MICRVPLGHFMLHVTLSLIALGPTTLVYSACMQNVQGLQQVGVDLIDKAPKLTESLTLTASSTLLMLSLTFIMSLPGSDMDKLGKVSLSSELIHSYTHKGCYCQDTATYKCMLSSHAYL